MSTPFLGNMNWAVEMVKNGEPVIVVDDLHREDEGDIVFSAEKVTERGIAFMIRESRGLMCVPCTGDRLERLEIPIMVPNSTDKQGTPFTVSVDAADDWITTGMSARERLRTIEIITSESSTPEMLVRPGHLFPLRAKPRLLKDRRGHTEASVELMGLCGLSSVAVISDIINDDGSMARGESLKRFAWIHHLPIISVEEIAYAVYGTNL